MVMVLAKTYWNTDFWQFQFLGWDFGGSPSRFCSRTYINDLFYLPEMTDVCNFADDTKTPSGMILVWNRLGDWLVWRLGHNTKLATEWLGFNGGEPTWS